MRKHKTRLEPYHKLFIVLVVVFLLIIIIFRPFRGADDSSITLNQSDTLTDDVDNSLTSSLSSLADSSSIIEGLACEEYYLEEGNTLVVEKHIIFIDKIGAGSVRLLVDGEQILLADGETIFSDSEIRITLPKGKLLYFGNNYDDNAVSLLVGCNRGENPNDKYVTDKGESICENLYETCKESFGIDY